VTMDDQHRRLDPEPGPIRAAGPVELQLCEQVASRLSGDSTPAAALLPEPIPAESVSERDSEIARLTGRDRKTIRRLLREGGPKARAAREVRTRYWGPVALSRTLAGRADPKSDCSRIEG
jgi:hypothetical protein